MNSALASRRLFLAQLGVGVGAVIASGMRSRRVHASVPSVQRPAIYVPETGHHVGGSILAWWLQYGRSSGIGWPITEQVRVGRRSVQYFERGALALSPAARDPLGVVLLDLGRPYVFGSHDQNRDSKTAHFFSKTGYGVHPEIWPYHREGGGVHRFGYPLGPATSGSGVLWQVFERAVLTANTAGVTELPLGVMEVERLRLSADRVAQAPHAPIVDLAALDRGFGPEAHRHAQVDLTRQVVTFFDAGQPVRTAAVSTGRYPDFTPAGRFRIFSRIARSRLVSDGSTAAVYNLGDVQHIQYFTEDWIGFHYAYWHNDFGYARSSGCVNLRLEDSKWAWRFFARGTPVSVDY